MTPSVLLFIVYLILTPVFSKSTYYSYERDEKMVKLAEEGHKRWSMLESMSSNPDCWKKAYALVQGSCMDMETEEKLQFSWNVLLCYYEDTGRPLPQCSSPLIRECTRQLSTFDFDIFTQLYHHGDSFCFYRESKEWRAKTEASIHKLEDTTSQTIEMLDHSIEKEEELLSLQSKNMEMHSTSLYQSTQVLQRLSQAERQLELFHNDLQSSFTLMKNETEAHLHTLQSMSNWTHERIDSLLSFNSMIQESLFNSQHVIHFAIRMVVAFIVTSIPGLTWTRVYVFVFLICSELIQQWIDWVPFCLLPAFMKPWILAGVQWCVGGGCVIHWLYSVTHHKDLDKENHQLLLELQQQVLAYQHQLQCPSDMEEIVFSEDECELCRALFPD